MDRRVASAVVFGFVVAVVAAVAMSDSSAVPASPGASKTTTIPETTTTALGSPQMEVSPNPAHADDELTFTNVDGSECDGGEVALTVHFGDTLVTSRGPIEPDGEGDWMVSFTIQPAPLGVYTADAECQAAESPHLPAPFVYDELFFEVVSGETFFATPDAGPAGTVFHFANSPASECDDGTVVLTAESDVTFADYVDPDVDGDWSAEFQVPNMGRPLEPGTYVIRAACYDNADRPASAGAATPMTVVPPGPLRFVYDDVSVAITDASAPPPTAPPAEPTPGEADFTG